MKFFLLIIASFGFFYNGYAQENIRGIFFENHSNHILGVRLINRMSRVEEHYFIDPETKAHVDTRLENFTLSAQLISSSFPIDCCVWKAISNGQTLIIEFDKERNRCYCEIK
jgi:hypothetical protein